MHTLQPNMQKTSGTQRRVTVHPPAKVNLSLVVQGKREDGYHDLHTVMATIDLTDTLTVVRSKEPGIRLHTTGLATPQGPENLVVRAAEAVLRGAGIDPISPSCPGLEIHLHKTIPAGAGLGGASSDAASCLEAVNHLLSLEFTTDQLAEIAATLGSDIPFFLYGPVALCTGRGEHVRPLDLRANRHILLIQPPVHAATVEVYRRYLVNHEQCQRQLRCVQQFLDKGDLNGLIEEGINSLTPAALQAFESLHRCHERLRRRGLHDLHLSGSGSCLFITSKTPARIALWAERLLELDESLTLRTVSFLTEHAKLFAEVTHEDFRDTSQFSRKQE